MADAKSQDIDFEKSSQADLAHDTLTESSRTTTQARENAQDLQQLEAVDSRPIYSTFSAWQKKCIVAMVAFAAFISPTSANIYFPALNAIQQDLNVSATLVNLTITSYMIFQGLAPAIFGDLADMGGRRPAYILAFIIYLGANVGIALQNNYAALFILRCLQSSGSSGAIALGYGVVADVSVSSERGEYMGYVGGMTMLGPAIGPVIGGILVQFLGWRSIFWFLTIIAACFLVVFSLAIPETGRNIVGNGSIPARGWNMTILEYLRHRTEKRRMGGSPTVERKLRWPNPLKTLSIVVEKDMALVLFYNGLIYTAFYDLMASLPKLYKEIYHFNDLQIGLCFLPFGAGCALAGIVNGRLLDRNYKRVARQVGFTIDRKRGDDLRHFPIERARLEVVWPLLSFGLVCMLCYGWVLEKHVNLAAPLVLMFFIGLCVNGTFTILSTLIVDLYPQSPSTATAANNLVRCFMGAGGTAIIDLMIAAMGQGWCFTLISLLCMATMPMLWAELRWGPKWREERMLRIDEARIKEGRNGVRSVEQQQVVESEKA